MSVVARPLDTDKQIRQFLEVMEFSDFFSQKNNQQYAFPGMTNIDGMMGVAIKLIKEANKDLADVTKYNTLVSSKYRSMPYKTAKQRAGLKKIILHELTTIIRPKDDNDICLGRGGMLPRSQEVDFNHKAYIIIGLPASGKSGIAARVSDNYNAVLIDSDFVKRKIPEFTLRNGASLVHEESKSINKIIKKEAISQGANIVLPIIGSDYENVVKTIKNLQDATYEVSLILVELDRIKAVQRAFSRFMHTGRYIPLSMILDEYSNSPSLVFYKLLANAELANIPLALIDSDVPYGQQQIVVLERYFPNINNIVSNKEKVIYG